MNNLTNLTTDQLDDLIARTEYAARGVAIHSAAADQDLYRAARRELAKRMGQE